MKPLQKYPLLFIVLLAISILTGCSSEPDPLLERIDRLSEKDPGLARDALDSIDPKSLAAPDRHLYDLLDIKIDDKNYVRHTSDSLILDVLDYYSSHKDSPRYPEVLYYAGRVSAISATVRRHLNISSRQWICFPRMVIIPHC